MATTMDLSAKELAQWLVERAPDRLWAVDGEYEIEQSISLPRSGTELAPVLEQRGGRLRIFGPPSPVPGRDLGRLSSVADGAADEISFRMAWLDGDRLGEEWFLETDLHAEAAYRAAQAS